MAEKIATREAYGNALAELGDKYDFVVLDADLAAATKTGTFTHSLTPRPVTKPQRGQRWARALPLRAFPITPM